MASKKPTGLGRGLGALLGEEALKAESGGSRHAAHLPGGELLRPAPEAL